MSLLAFQKLLRTVLFNHGHWLPVYLSELCIPVAYSTGRSHLRSAAKECLVISYCRRTTGSEVSRTLAQHCGTRCHWHFATNRCHCLNSVHTAKDWNVLYRAYNWS